MVVDEACREAVAGSYLARGLEPAAIDRVAELGARRAFVPGEPLLRRNAPDDDLHILLAGRARVMGRTGETLHEIAAGSVVGEIALLDRRPRSASVEAITACDVLAIPASQLLELIESDTAIGVVILKNLAGLLCERLRSTSAQLDTVLVLQAHC
ncbi:MAG TPA: cyclic nucleotide-binding domain-containing protein [Fimbriimonadaceae bacterium]|nr:cyclic nucleotide-binding domain-containing protein [Fimbriimonadaceae bacterium]